MTERGPETTETTEDDVDTWSPGWLRVWMGGALLVVSMLLTRAAITEEEGVLLVFAWPIGFVGLAFAVIGCVAEGIKLADRDRETRPPG